MVEWHRRAEKILRVAQIFQGEVVICGTIMKVCSLLIVFAYSLLPLIAQSRWFRVIVHAAASALERKFLAMCQ
jgi:hypothetical protein